MQTFSIRDLHKHSGDLTREAEAGHLALVTKHGQPLFVSVPFDDTLLQTGVHVALAVNLFKSGELSSGKAAELARMPKLAFLETVSRLGIPVVDYPAEELKAELANFR